MLNEPLFTKKKPPGKIIDDSEDMSERIKLTTLIDPNQVFGRNMEIFNIVRFLVSDEFEKIRVLNLSSVTSVNESGSR